MMIKLPWPLRLDIAYFVGQVIGGVFDNDCPALVIALEILTASARAEIAKTRLPPVQVE